MPKGYLKVQTMSEQGTLPLKEAMIRIYQNNDKDIVNESFSTSDSLGFTPYIPLEAPASNLSLDFNHHRCPYALYCIEIRCEGYENMEIENVQIFESVYSTLPLNLIPITTKSTHRKTFPIPKHSLFKGQDQRRSIAPSSLTHTFLPMSIPKEICVHLGKANQKGENIRVEFIYYLKNIASSELYPTWKKAALKAFIHTQISFVLNRIHTKHYQNKGYLFEITNDAREDQTFIRNRNIFDNISQIVDEIFNEYFPLDSTLSNTTQTIIYSSSQKWKMQKLATENFSTLQILQSYYGKNIHIITTNNLQSILHTFPGTSLKRGTSGSDVALIQTHLNTIAKTYHTLIKPLNVDGEFGKKSEECIKNFQKYFTLEEDGIVGKSTWYKIEYLYITIKNNPTFEIDQIKKRTLPSFPNSVEEGYYSESIQRAQVALNTISSIYSDLAVIIPDGYYNEDTKKAIRRFQTIVKLTNDTALTRETWNVLFTVAMEIQNGDDPSFGLPKYPKKLKTVDIKRMQEQLQNISMHYPSIPKVEVNGILNNKTKSAISIFQNVFGLRHHPEIKKQTWYKINEVYYQLNV